MVFFSKFFTCIQQGVTTWHLSDTTKSQPLASTSWRGVTSIDS